MRSAMTVRSELPGRLHVALRAATRSDHVAHDSAVARLNPGSPKGYGAYLRMHHAVLAELEADWREQDREDFGTLLRGAQRDLTELKATGPKINFQSRAPLPRAQGIGVAYVVRALQSAAVVLRQRIAGRQPSSYLDSAPKLTWPQFLLQLDPDVVPLARISSYEAIRGARFAFGLYASSLSDVKV
jgi:heme oxygenase